VDYSKKRKLFISFSVGLFLFIFFMGFFSAQLNFIDSNVIGNVEKPEVISFDINIIKGKIIDFSKDDEMWVSTSIVSIDASHLRDVVFDYGIDGVSLKQETLAVSNNNEFLEIISVPQSISVGDHTFLVRVYDLEGDILGTSTESFTVVGEIGIFRRIMNFLF